LADGCSSIEDREDSDVDEADCVGESEGEGSAELAEDDVDVAVRLVAGLLPLGRAVVDAMEDNYNQKERIGGCGRAMLCWRG
jgi:hypothetical protein